VRIAGGFRLLTLGRCRLYVEGKIQYKEYEKDGVKKTITQIEVGRDGSMTIVQQALRDRQAKEQQQLHEESA
jgi:hypothetical protein